MVNGTIPLVETKLHAPRRRGVVARPRLRDRLSRRGPPSLTLVSAAAGFGKTTLVADWFADGPATAWLSLDRRDNDPTLFWTYVVAALQSVTPDAGSAARRSLDAAQPSIDAVVATLLNDLQAVASDLVLVLDDYHVIESPAIHESMAFLLEHLPPHVHLVIASRADPPLPLASLRARGELAGGPGGRPALHHRRGSRVPPRRHGPDARPERCRGARRSDRGMDRRPAARGALDAGPRGHRRVHRRVRRRRPLHPRLPRRGGARPPELRGAELPARDVHPRPAHRATLRRRHRPNRRPGDARAARTGQPLPRPAR